MRTSLKVLFFFCWMAGFHHRLAAQQTPVVHVPAGDTLSTRWIVKWAPYSILDPDATIQGGFEYKINSRLGFQQEIGFGKFSYWQTESDDETRYLPKTVIRLRTELRRYFSKQERNPEGGYWAVEAFYKYTSQPHEAEANMGMYFQQVEYRRIKNVFGLHAKVGIQVRAGSRFLFDFYGGLGFRVIDIQTPGWDEGRGWFVFSRGSGTYNAPSMSMGGKIGYAIR